MVSRLQGSLGSDRYGSALWLLQSRAIGSTQRQVIHGEQGVLCVGHAIASVIGNRPLAWDWLGVALWPISHRRLHQGREL